MVLLFVAVNIGFGYCQKSVCGPSRGYCCSCLSIRHLLSDKQTSLQNRADAIDVLIGLNVIAKLAIMATIAFDVSMAKCL